WRWRSLLRDGGRTDQRGEQGGCRDNGKRTCGRPGRSGYQPLIHRQILLLTDPASLGRNGLPILGVSAPNTAGAWRPPPRPPHFWGPPLQSPPAGTAAPPARGPAPAGIFGKRGPPPSPLPHTRPPPPHPFAI